jgi:HlyD family secretion protein
VKKLLVVLILVGAALAGLAYWISQPATRAVTPDIFAYAQIVRGPMTESVSATGLLQPRDVRVVSSELPGTVVDVHAKVNDIVAPGDVLVRLDARKLQLKVDEARDGVRTAGAAVAQAEAMQDAAALGVRYQRAIEKGGGFRTDLEEAEAKLKAAQAGVAVAQARLGAAKTLQKEAELALAMTVVRVPGEPAAGAKMTYHVLEKKVQPGQLVGPPASFPLFTLAGDLRRMEVHAEMAEGDIGRIRKGLGAVFTVSAYWEPEVKFRGTVRDIHPVPANVKGAIFYTTVIEVENRKDAQTGEWMLRPGMTSSVDVVTRSRTGVWKVPSAALNFQMEEPYQSEAAKARLAQWRERSDREDWRPVWVWDAARHTTWPIFVRVGGVKNGETGLKDGDFNEILEWEQRTEPTGDQGPRVIINAPPARRPGFFDQPANIKLS